MFSNKKGFRFFLNRFRYTKNKKPNIIRFFNFVGALGIRPPTGGLEPSPRFAGLFETQRFQRSDLKTSDLHPQRENYRFPDPFHGFDSLEKFKNTLTSIFKFVGALGIEPKPRAPKARILPLYYAPISLILNRISEKNQS